MPRAAPPPRRSLPTACSYESPSAALRQQHFEPRRRSVMVRRREEVIEEDTRRARQETLTQMVEAPSDGSRRQSSARSGSARERSQFPQPRASAVGETRGQKRMRAAERARRQNTLTQMQFVQLGLVPDSDEEQLKYEDVGPELHYGGEEEGQAVESKSDLDEPAHRLRKKRKTGGEISPNVTGGREDVEATNLGSRPARRPQKNTKTRQPAKRRVAIKEEVEEFQSPVRPSPSPRLVQNTPRRERIPSSQSPDESPVLSRRNDSATRLTRSPLRPRSSNIKMEPVCQTIKSPYKGPRPIAPTERNTARVNVRAAREAPVNAAIPRAGHLIGMPTARHASPRSTDCSSPSNVPFAGPTRYADVSLTIPDSDEDEDAQFTRPCRDSLRAIHALPYGAAIQPANHPPRPPPSSPPNALLPPPTFTQTPVLPTLSAFSQATTVDLTQPTQRSRLTQATRTQHPSPATIFRNAPSFSSSPVLTRACGSQPERDERAAVGPGSGQHGVVATSEHEKRMTATESQLLPDSIMNFELPRLPGWSQQSL